MPGAGGSCRRPDERCSSLLPAQPRPSSSHYLPVGRQPCRSGSGCTVAALAAPAAGVPGRPVGRWWRQRRRRRQRGRASAACCLRVTLGVSIAHSSHCRCTPSIRGCCPLGCLGPPPAAPRSPAAATRGGGVPPAPRLYTSSPCCPPAGRPRRPPPTLQLMMRQQSLHLLQRSECRAGLPGSSGGGGAAAGGHCLPAGTACTTHTNECTHQQRVGAAAAHTTLSPACLPACLQGSRHHRGPRGRRACGRS